MKSEMTRSGLLFIGSKLSAAVCKLESLLIVFKLINNNLSLEPLLIYDPAAVQNEPLIGASYNYFSSSDKVVIFLLSSFGIGLILSFGFSTTTEKFMCTCELLLIFCTKILSTILAMQESKNTAG
jgi:hypothetical protein